MFDISWGEFLVVGVVALIVIGPKELPGVIRAVGRGMAKLRTMASDFRGQFDEAMREAEMQNVAKDLNEFKNQAMGLSTSTFDPIRRELQGAVDTVKETAATAGAATGINETLQAVQSEAQSMEAEIRASASDAAPAAPEPAPISVTADAPAEAPADPVPANLPEPKAKAGGVA
jgi:sec-independent protein translocase protein TatB